MKKTIWLFVAIAGIAGMLLGVPQGSVKAEPRFEIHSRPDFVYLPEQRFSIALSGPYNMILVDDEYYIHRHGEWFRASHFRGPWHFIPTNDLPHRIRRYSWEEIKDLRESEYRRHDRRYWEERHHHERRDWEDRHDHDR